MLYVPVSLALYQKLKVPEIRLTFGTGMEFSNSLRLVFSRLAEHRCSSGYYLEPNLAVVVGQGLVCLEYGEHFYVPSVEELVFNS